VKQLSSSFLSSCDVVTLVIGIFLSDILCVGYFPHVLILSLSFSWFIPVTIHIYIHVIVSVTGGLFLSTAFCLSLVLLIVLAICYLHCSHINTNSIFHIFVCPLNKHQYVTHPYNVSLKSNCK